MSPRKLWALTQTHSDEGTAHAASLPDDFPLGDSVDDPNRSRLLVLEDGVPLGPGHALHADIRQIGAGRYSHWRDAVLFSTSDNSDPETNGRAYHAILPLDFGAEPSVPKPLRDDQILYEIDRFGDRYGHLVMSPLPPEMFGGDTNEEPDSSPLQLLEDGVPLGPAHSLHSDIGDIGLGRFCHWQQDLLFSTSDNSDPASNGRRYEVLIPALRRSAGDRAASGKASDAGFRRRTVDDAPGTVTWRKLGLDAAAVGSFGQNLTIIVRSRRDRERNGSVLLAPETRFAGFQGKTTRLSEAGLREQQAAGPEESHPASDTTALNAALSACETEWALVIDDDVTFGPEVLKALDQITAEPSFPFYSVAITDGAGEVRLRDRLLVQPEHAAMAFRLLSEDEARRLEPPALGARLVPALWTGPILIKTKAFTLLGGFDPDLSNGLERLDLSLRLAQAAVPIGSASFRGLTWADPSDAPATLSDFASIIAAEGNETQGEHLARKHRVAVDPLLPSRLWDLAVDYTVPFTRGAAPTRHGGGRPRIALIVDWDNWAFASIARQVVKHNSEHFDFIVIPSGCFTNPVQIFMMCADCDLIHFFFRSIISWLFTDDTRRYWRTLGLDTQTFMDRFVHSKTITTGIYDHLLLDEQNLSDTRRVLNDVVRSYYTSSPKLHAIYGRMAGCRAPTVVMTDGVDLDRFSPRDLGRFDDPQGRELVVGWVGNSAWRSDLGDPKGVHTILLPALERLNAARPVFRPYFADRNTNYVPSDEMPAYYGRIDILVCSSDIEGTPNPVLEAMACGVPVISTDVGIVAEAFGPLQRRFLLPERTVDCMARALDDLQSNRHLLRELARENLISIQKWSWDVRARAFRSFFSEALEASRTAAASSGSG